MVCDSDIVLDSLDDDEAFEIPLTISDDELDGVVSTPHQATHRFSSEHYDALSADDIAATRQVDDEATEDDVGDEALTSLEDLVLSFLTQLADALPNAYSQPSDTKKVGGKRVVVQLVDRRKDHTEGNAAPMRSIAMPQRSRGPSARPFAQLFKTVDLMHEALIDNVPTTKRDMFYKDVSLFGAQSTVDRLVDDLAATLHLRRSDLSVRASAKGLICGSGLKIHLQSGETVELSDSEPALIPHSEDIHRFEVDEGLAWVLVVEKEAVFQTLCTVKLGTHHLLGKGLVITGKGYPDVATRQLVNVLSANLSPHIPILGLVDGDAYGIDILSVYKYGSTSMQHEKDQLAAARIQWLGLWASELAALGIPKDALIPITKHDEKKARSLLKRHGIPSEWRRELQYMLFTRRKAEIEVLSSVRSTTTADGAADLALNKHAHSGEPSRTGIPLLRYLVAKISAACVEARSMDP